VGGAAIDEQPVDLVQAAQFHLADGAGLFEPTEFLLYQPATAQAHGVARMPGLSPIEVRAALVLVIDDMYGDAQFSCGFDEVAVLGLVRAQRDAPPASFTPGFEHQQRGLAFGVAVAVVAIAAESAGCSSPPANGPDKTDATPCRRCFCTGAHHGRWSGSMRVNRSLLLMEDLPVVALRIGVRTVSRVEALLRRPGLDQGAVDGETVVRQ
jgi:hypothetical protein